MKKKGDIIIIYNPKKGERKLREAKDSIAILYISFFFRDIIRS